MGYGSSASFIIHNLIEWSWNLSDCVISEIKINLYELMTCECDGLFWSFKIEQICTRTRKYRRLIVKFSILAKATRQRFHWLPESKQQLFSSKHCQRSGKKNVKIIVTSSGGRKWKEKFRGKLYCEVHLMKLILIWESFSPATRQSKKQETTRFTQVISTKGKKLRRQCLLCTFFSFILKNKINVLSNDES